MSTAPPLGLPFPLAFRAAAAPPGGGGMLPPLGGGGTTWGSCPRPGGGGGVGRTEPPTATVFPRALLAAGMLDADVGVCIPRSVFLATATSAVVAGAACEACTAGTAGIEEFERG